MIGRRWVKNEYLLDVIGVHNNDNTEESDGNEEIDVLERSSYSRCQDMWESFLNPNKSLFRIHPIDSLLISILNHPHENTKLDHANLNNEMKRIE